VATPARQRYWHPSWIEPDRHYRQIRIDHTIRSLTLARELGARCITTEPGGPVAPGESWSSALRLFVEMLKPVIAHAEKEGVLLLIEPEPGRSRPDDSPARCAASPAPRCASSSFHETPDVIA